MEWLTIIGVIGFVAAIVAFFLTPFAMGLAYISIGLIPLGAINLALGLQKKERRLLMLWATYLAWVGSIILLTLLSIAANWRTKNIYGGSAELAFGVTVIEIVLTTLGVCAALYSLSRVPVKFRFVTEDSDYSVSNMPIRLFIYWGAWFAGLFVLNWVIDMIYIFNVGVPIQGIGPGWIDMVEQWF